jgi:NAD(P)-dependent dehydrogenase (short-subunit alcohol dehydrogenase family)
MGIPFQGIYSAAKFALEGMSEALRMEVKPFGIHVVLIEPGDFSTNLTRNRFKTAESGQKSAYSETFQSALSLMEKKEALGPTPEKLALLVEKIIETPSPRLRYTIGTIDQRLSVLFKRLVPAGLFERSMMSYYRLPKSR